MTDVIPSGTLLGGKYRIGALLGQGGMGAVYEGMQEGLDRRVALKVLHPHLSGEKELLGRFQREARAVATLGHPNVVQISDFQANPGEPPFLVMELLQGESLRELLKRTGPLPPERAAYIFSQVLAALEAAHAKDIVHRDIKPDNIFLSSTSVQADLVKVLDFGVAKVLRDGDKDGKLTQSGFVVGTLSYMAPEQAMGDELDGRADLYSVGACMYLALTGRKPFDAPTTPALLKAILTEKPVPLAALRQDIDLSLAALVDRALQRDPKDRFANAGEMAAALAPFAKSTPHEARASDVPTQPREAAPAPTTEGRQPVPTAMTAQLRPGAAAPVEPAAELSQRTTAVPVDAPAATAPAPAPGPPTAATAAVPLPRGPKGTLVSPARPMPPRPATAPVVVEAAPAPELLTAAVASPPSFTPAPHAMESPPMVASTTTPNAAGHTAVMPASPAPAPVASPPPAPILEPAPVPSATQPAAAPWTPPPAAAVPMAAAPPFVPHAPAPAKRRANTTLLWVGVALIGTITVVALVVGSLVLRQMMVKDALAVPAGPSAATTASTASALADSTAEAEPLPMPSASAASAPTPAATGAKPKSSTATAAPSAAAALHPATASTAVDLSGNQAGIGTAKPTATATATTTTTTTTTTTATATATATAKPTATSSPGNPSHQKKGPK